MRRFTQTVPFTGRLGISTSEREEAEGVEEAGGGGGPGNLGAPARPRNPSLPGDVSLTH